MIRRLRGAVVVSFVTTMLFGAHFSSAQSVIQLDEFLSRLDQAIDLAAAGSQDPAPARMTALRDTLGLPLTIEVHGVPVRLTADPALSQLRGETAGEFDEARAHLLQLREAAVRALEGEPADAELIQRAVARAFQGVSQQDVGILESIRRILVELLQNLLNGLRGLPEPAPLLGWLIVAALVLGAVWLVARARLVPERSMGDRSRSMGQAIGPDWRALADDALRRGDLREAVSALYRSLLATLARRGVVMDPASVTAGECRTAVRIARPNLYRAVADATGRFERVVYGEERPSAADIESLRQAETMARR